MTGAVIPSKFWRNFNDFVTNSIGFNAYHDNRLASIAFAVFIEGNTLELGIETNERYRGKTYKTIYFEGMARIDFFLTIDNQFILNELNILPGFTEISMYPKLWEHTGISYKDLITKLIELALQRNNNTEVVFNSRTSK